MSKVILTDCDEVLFDWATPFAEWIRETYPEYRDTPGELQDHWHIEAWLGCSLEESRDMVRIFNGNPEFWTSFKPLPGVVENVHKFYQDGYSFVAITACATDRETYLGRWKNLEEVFGYGVFDTLHCVGLSESKRPYLARYHPTIWVEDKARHAIDGAEVGHQSFLINYQHNIRDGHNIPGVTRVDDWHDIYAHVKGPVLV
jgi:hypothetical protein